MPSSAISSLSAGTLALADLTVIQETGGANKSTPGQKLFDVINVLAAGSNATATDTITVFDGTAAYKATIQQFFNSINVLGTATGTLSETNTLLVHNGASAQRVEYGVLATSLYDGDSGSTGWIQRGSILGYNATGQLGENLTFAANTGATANLPYRYRTSSAAGTNTVSRLSGNPSHWWGHSIQHSSLICLEGTTKNRFFVGLWDQQVHMSTATSGTWTDTGTTHLGVKISGIGFRFSTSAGDTNWMFCSGSNGNFAFYDTGVTANVNEMQNLEFRLSGTNVVDVYINGTQTLDVALYGSNIPDAPIAPLGWSIGSATLADSTAKFWNMARYLTAQKFW